jgi:peptide/nickel transport system substrate-binding protein
MSLRFRFKLLSASLTLAGVMAIAPGVALAAPLSIAIGGSITSADPHFYNAAPNNTLAMHLFDRLTETTPDIQIRPGLAESWTPISDTEWEFKLRKGVKWHDGKPFTAADVAYTIERAPNVPNSPGGFGGFLRAIKKVDIVDDHTVRMHTDAPAPNLPRDLAFVAVISRHVGETATTEDYNSGKAAIGTGPFKFASYTPGDRVEMVRNEDWWGNKPEWDKVTLRVINNPGARVAALLSGGVDVIDTPPATDLPRLQKDEKVSVFSTPGVRLIYVQADFSRPGNVPGVTDNAGKPLEKNPFLDKRVRQALSHAINRDALASRVMQNTAVPAGQWLPEGLYSYAPDVKPPKFDIEAAKKLLADAGYPDGFKMVLSTPNDRYPNDASTAQAVASMWSRIGVQTAVDAIPWSSYAARRAKQDFGMGLVGWGSTTGEAGYMLVNILGTFDQAKRTGANNAGRYSNPELDVLRDKALSTLDDGEREKLLIQAVEMSMNDLGVIPLHMLLNFWGVRKGLEIDPRKDERTLAIDIRTAKK